MFFDSHLSARKSQNNRNNVSCRYRLNLLLCLSLLLTQLVFPGAQAASYAIPNNGSRLIGEHELYKVKTGDYFHSIAQFYNIGLIALMDANPSADPFLPVPGTQLQIPKQMILPDVPYRGIVINLPELRLYYFSEKTNQVHVFPVGIGRIDRPTPTMQSKVMSKIKHPSWRANARFKADYFAKYGKQLPGIVPPGADNPLGDYALQLAFADNNYLIHGTNKNFGIGLRVSAGCIRMNPEDIAWLFAQVSVNEPVRIINQPIKTATEPNGENILEVHSPLSKISNTVEYDFEGNDDVLKFNNQYNIDRLQVKKALLLQQGLPINVNI